MDALDASHALPNNDGMTVFATEFPVKSNVNRAAFVSEVIAWLRGMRDSSVLSSGSESDLDEENAVLRSSSGEELRVRELRQNDVWNAIGFRHDFPDGEGRLWRTEGVLKRSAAVGEQDVVRLRTQCLAKKPGAHLEAPLKPYLIKALLKNGWGGNDLIMNVADQPIWLDDSVDGLKVARAVTIGEASKWLPTLYISATGKGAWLLDKQEIEKLAYDLGGIAHVVVEPDRAFSFRLRDECSGRNAYGGTVALAVPNQGIVRRYYLGWQIQDAAELAAKISEAASTLRGQMPMFGWDWTELQEQALRAQRTRDRSRLSTLENEQLFNEEIENLQDRIQQLEQQLASRRVEAIGTDEGEFSTDNLVRLIGPEVWSGEISDSLRLAAKSTLTIADKIGLDARSKVILQRFVDRVPLSPALDELSQDIGRATKESKRVANELISLLARHGYREKSDNKHIRLEAVDSYDGLAPITIAKTPSEYRGLKNLRAQIEGTIGITSLTKK